MTDSRQILDAAWIKRAIARLAHEVVERNGGAEELVIVGLYTNGILLAERLAAAITELEGCQVPVGTMDITLYRDDVGIRANGPRLPDRRGTQMPVDISEKTVLLVDDVLNTGRSIRAALDQLMDFGRARKVQLAGLIDRGGRELPIRPDFVGRKVTIGLDENVRVRLVENDGVDEVLIVPKGT